MRDTRSAFARIAPIIADHHGDNPLITPETTLAGDLEFDGFDLVELQGELCRELGLRFWDGDDIEAAKTVADVAEMVDRARPVGVAA